MSDTTAPTQDSKAAVKQQLKAIELESKRLELEKTKHDLIKAKEEAERSVADSRSRALRLEVEERGERERKATEILRGHYIFDDKVSDGTVSVFSDWLARRRLVAPGEPVTLTIYSQGGSVFAGFVMMDAMREAREDGVHITAKITGMGASMAGFIAQAADVRLIGHDSYLMIHEISQGMMGHFSQSDLEDEADFTRRLSRRALQYYVDRSDGKWTVEALEAKTKKFSWWLNADEAVAEGFCDAKF